ncbi:MAG TPA: hypothetical protein VM571_02395 [Noviherbaspirillum sp.]|nr:hypothetical protein [Noviherbaspirillum sp.]
MPKQSFSDWLAALLRHLALPLPAGPAQPAATFHFEGKPKVYVTGRSGQVDFISEAGALSAPYPSDTLLALLELNRCSEADDAVSVMLDRASGAVIVWARQRQEKLSAADAGGFLQLVRQKVDAVQKLLGRSSQPASGRSAGSLSRMLRTQAAHNR